MRLLSQNTKLKRTSKIEGERVLNFSIPAYKSATGKITCPYAGPCKEFCYAQKKFYKMPNVKKSHEGKLELTMRDDFADLMTAELKLERPTYVRIHDSGDFYSKEYIHKWFKVMRSMPSIRFYAYTNSIRFFEAENVKPFMPDNFDLIYSTSGVDAHLIDKQAHRHACIFDDAQSMKDQEYSSAKDSDLKATKWFTKTNKIGLIFH